MNKDGQSLFSPHGVHPHQLRISYQRLALPGMFGVSKSEKIVEVSFLLREPKPYHSDLLSEAGNKRVQILTSMYFIAGFRDGDLRWN